jgi:hypothetical protein
MTHIVSPHDYPSKKAFKEAVKADPSRVYLDDPSMFNPISGSVASIMAKTSMITVTNHPKRSWFACIKANNGLIKVE